MRPLHLFALGIAAALALNPMLGRAEDPPAKKWKNAGEVSVVSTNGNSNTTTMSAKDTFLYRWRVAVMELIGGGLNSTSDKEVKAEQYNASEKLMFPLAGADTNYLYEKFAWDSNRFSGYYNRYDANAGYGRVILDVSSNTLRGEFGGGYINEERVAAPRNDFVSGRAYTKYKRIISATANFTQDVEYLYNFDNNKDYRLNMETALIASMTSHLAMKASYVWKRVGVPPPGIGKDDTITSVALVINY